MKFEKILSEAILKYDTDYYVYDKMDEAYDIFLEAYDSKNSKLGEQRWRLIPADMLRNVWVSRVMHGFVRHERPLQTMKEIIIENTAKLRVNTELVGHATFHDPIKDLEDKHGLKIEDEDYYYDFVLEFVNIKGVTAYSDYGLLPLEKVLVNILPESDPEKLLVEIDKALNVYHQRSDLSALFVEGGQETLSKLSS